MAWTQPVAIAFSTGCFAATWPNGSNWRTGSSGRARGLAAAPRHERSPSSIPAAELDLPPGRPLQEGTGAPWMLTMQYEDFVKVAQEADSAMRTALQGMGLGTAPDLQGTDVPDATVAVSNRILSGDPLWIAMWSAAEEADLGTSGADGRPVREARPWQGPWAQLWDEVSCAAWEAAQGAAVDVGSRLGAQGNLGRALRLSFTRTAGHCTHHLVALYESSWSSDSGPRALGSDRARRAPVQPATGPCPSGRLGLLDTSAASVPGVRKQSVRGGT